MESKEEHVTGRAASKDLKMKRKVRKASTGNMTTSTLIVGNNKRGGPSTPSPTWRLQEGNTNNREDPVHEFLGTTNRVSARKLCANLWENQTSQHRQNRNFGSYNKDKVNGLQSVGVSGTKRQVDGPAKKLHLPVEGNGHNLKAQTPESSDRSVEVAHYESVQLPSSSSNLKGKRHDEASYGLKPSTELVKVLNRIWSLEEQQASHLSLLKALKMELEDSRSHIKDLLKEKQIRRQVIDDMRKQVAEDKAVRKVKNKDHIKAAVRSVQEEFDSEKKLREHSGSLKMQLARELSELKLSFSSAFKELERERRARIVLEKLCDEFAKGIKSYEKMVRSLKHGSQVDHFDVETPDHMILHISEAWLDELMQMKLVEGQNNTREKSTIVDKLALDIETFLRTRNSTGPRRRRSISVNELRRNCSRRESFPLNEARSAPQAVADGEDSTDSDSHCFELSKAASLRQHGDIGEFEREGFHRQTSRRVGVQRLNSKSMSDNLVRIHSLSSEGDKIYPEDGLKEDIYTDQPVFRGHASPVQKWKSKLASPEFDKSETSAKSQKESTLKSKLLEARMEGRRSRLREG